MFRWNHQKKLLVAAVVIMPTTLGLTFCATASMADSTVPLISIVVLCGLVLGCVVSICGVLFALFWLTLFAIKALLMVADIIAATSAEIAPLKIMVFMPYFFVFGFLGSGLT